jgi:Effector-associated domain 1
MNLSGQQHRKLQNALINAFPDAASLRQMLRFELDKNLDEIAREGSLREVVFELIKAACSQGWVEELIRAACNSNPNNSYLREMAKEIGLELPDEPKIEIKSSQGQINTLNIIRGVSTAITKQQSFWSQWVLLTSSSSAIAFASSFGIYGNQLAGIFLGGIFIGCAQWWALKQQIPKRISGWLTTTCIGWILGRGISTIFITPVIPEILYIKQYPDLLQHRNIQYIILMLLLGGLLCGAGLAFPQSFVLKRFCILSKLWVPINAIAMALSFFVGAIVSINAENIIGIIMGGTTFGIINGSAIIILLQNER